MLKAVFFDLDGTLLPMDMDEFTNGYFDLLCKRAEAKGYEREKLISTIWGGTKQMIKNDGKKTNEEVFWNYFASVYGEEKLADKSMFDKFYVTDFKKTKQFCGENKLAKEIVDYCCGMGLEVVLSTNPIFPLDGMLTRLGFIGLDEDDFDYISSYENSKYSKPNPKFFKEILNKLKLKESEVVLFGNDEVEDAKCAESLGMKFYLIGDHIVKDKSEEHNYEVIKMEDVISKINKLLSEK